jgi:group I intron endonuclease
MEKKSGIYKIENLINGKIYVGRAIDLFNRRKYHFKYLIENKHHNKYLQEDFNKYGKEKFKFSIIEECDISILNEKEKYFIKERKCCHKDIGYNIHSGGNSPERNRNKPPDHLKNKNELNEKINNNLAKEMELRLKLFKNNIENIINKKMVTVNVVRRSRGGKKINNDQRHDICKKYIYMYEEQKAVQPFKEPDKKKIFKILAEIYNVHHGTIHDIIYSNNLYKIND